MTLRLRNTAQYIFVKVIPTTFSNPVIKILNLNSNTGTKVTRSQKIKKAEFGHKQFQKRPNPQK